MFQLDQPSGNRLRRLGRIPVGRLAEDGAGLLTTGKLNAVRAAFKAGVKPSAIARQFGISQSSQKGAGVGAASGSLISLLRVTSIIKSDRDTHTSRLLSGVRSLFGNCPRPQRHRAIDLQG
jgi:hypothetical protein